MIYLEVGTILFTSILTALLIYKQVSATSLHQLDLFLMIILMIYLGKVIWRKEVATLSRTNTLIVTSLTAFLTQVVIISTGGFYSPLMIIVHLYTITSGFLLNIITSLTFLFSTLLVLGYQIYSDTNIQQKFREDPGIAAIYFVSFLITIPLAQYVTKTYHIKDKMSKALGEYLEIGHQRERSILSGMNELVFITDKNLKIESTSESARRLLNTSDEAIKHKPLLDEIQLFTQNGSRVSIDSLPIKEILGDKTIRVVKDLRMIIPTGQNTTITIQIKPIKNSHGEVDQLVFILTDARLSLDTQGYHQDLEFVLTRYQQSLSNLKTTLNKSSSGQVSAMVEVLSHIEEDLRTALEMEDHPLKEKIDFEDIAYLSRQVILDKQNFAQKLGVNLNFSLSEEETSEESLIRLKDQHVESKLLGKSDFTVPIDAIWLKLLVQKLVDLSILLTTVESNPEVDLRPSRLDDNLLIELILNAQITENELNDLFIKDYGSLGLHTNLRYGSGIEGFLAQAIATELKLSLSAKLLEKPNRVVFTLVIPTKPK